MLSIALKKHPFGIIEKTKTFKILLNKNECKGRIELIDDLVDASIYFFPNGISIFIISCDTTYIYIIKGKKEVNLDIVHLWFN